MLGITLLKKTLSEIPEEKKTLKTAAHTKINFANAEKRLNKHFFG